MNTTDADKIDILLNRLDFHSGEIHRREDMQLKLFEWSTTLLLGVLAVVIALSDRRAPLPYAMLVKCISSLLIAVPTFVSAQRIWSERPSLKRQAEVIEEIEEVFHLFEKGYYIADDALYPERWRGSLAAGMLRSKTPVYYVVIMALMTLCVIATMWLIL